MSNAGTVTIAPSVGEFLYSIKQHESGGDYTAYNSTYGASGAYQFIPSTWQGVMNEIDPTGTLAKQYPTASSAPQQIQDNAAALYASQLYYGPAGQNWGNVAEAWYGGTGAIGHPEWGDPNNPQAPTVGQYATTILASMPTSGQTAAFSATPNQATTTSFWGNIWNGLGNRGIPGIGVPPLNQGGIGGIVKGAEGLASAAKTSADAIGAIFNSATWVNFGSIIGGGILMYVGFRLIEADLKNSKQSVGQVATQAAQQPVQVAVTGTKRAVGEVQTRQARKTARTTAKAKSRTRSEGRAAAKKAQQRVRENVKKARAQRVNRAAAAGSQAASREARIKSAARKGAKAAAAAA